MSYQTDHHVETRFDGKAHFIGCACGWQSARPYQFTTVEGAAREYREHLAESRKFERRVNAELLAHPRSA